MATKYSVSIHGLEKTYGSLKVLHGIDLDIEDGDFLVLLGPSGCGKSTLLNIIAGLDHPTNGYVAIGGQDVTNLQPKDRDIAMVFQSYALYPTKTAYETMALGLRMRRTAAAEIDRRVRSAAEKLRIEPLLSRKPSQMSGGQRQRVAIGRAIVRDPKLFLFDEPLSNLDAKLREELKYEIKQLHRTSGATAVYVTHDRSEALTLATKVAVMHEGSVLEFGKPENIFVRPSKLQTAKFVLHDANFISAKIVAREGARQLQILGTVIPLDRSVELPIGSPGDVVVCLRANQLVVSKQSQAHRFRAELQDWSDHAFGTHSRAVVDGQVLAFNGGNEPQEVGNPIELSPDVNAALIYDKTSGALL